MRRRAGGHGRGRARAAAAILAAAVVLLPASIALGHGEEHEEPMPTASPPAAGDDHAEHEGSGGPGMGDGEEGGATPTPGTTSEALPLATRLTVEAPEAVGLGERLELRAVLRTAAGRPIEGASVTFFLVSAWGTSVREVELGSALTDEAGVASLTTDARREGEVSFGARFGGDESLGPSEGSRTVSVATGGPLYVPEVGIRLPGLGVWWLLVVVAAVWGLYFLVVRQVAGIARSADGAAGGAIAGGSGEGPDPSGAGTPSRRRFLTRWLLPAGLSAAVVSVGSGLLAVVARSPRTHSNREALGWSSGSRHAHPPIARVGEWRPARPLPPTLDREVSFSSEVLPLLLEKGGPHTHLPRNSPPPHGVRLDAYGHVMVGNPGAGGEDQPHAHRLVVPGEPEESMLVQILVDAARRMPPAAPLSEEEIQVIASWVAQGARDN
ncbi:MAG: hypothetical protein HY658_06420 [Actinobacteria bacterium]|nr:hypothetical protein [Actinomycetota bacterium]